MESAEIEQQHHNRTQVPSAVKVRSSLKGEKEAIVTVADMPRDTGLSHTFKATSATTDAVTTAFLTAAVQLMLMQLTDSVQVTAGFNEWAACSRSESVAFGSKEPTAQHNLNTV
jgi:hypothetical protein